MIKIKIKKSLVSLVSLRNFKTEKYCDTSMNQWISVLLKPKFIATLMPENSDFYKNWNKW